MSRPNDLDFKVIRKPCREEPEAFGHAAERSLGLYIGRVASLLGQGGSWFSKTRA
jgi:hypothetical protein